ncbi:MAG: hypothetical protein JWO03_2563 [Bacteroidetes bacterium]|nr:hypothetical protein [Bacteroidota bacterium]
MAIDSAMAESNQTTAIEDVQNERSFKVFPNPAYDLLHIELPNSKAPESITIKDIAGKEMLTRSYSSTINIYSLSEGIYFVSIRLANGDLASKKFIKL